MVHASLKYPFGSTSAGPAKIRQKPPPLHLITHGNDGNRNGSSWSSGSSSSLSAVPTTDDSNAIDLSTTESPQAAVTGISTGSSLHGLPKSRAPHTERPTLRTESSRPQALCLRVLPSTKSFLRSREVVNDIKIDVYLNGDLCASAYIAERAFQGKGYGGTTFSGARNHRLTEVPWILEPPRSNITETPIEPAQAIEQANSRWAKISNGLISAAELNGRNSQNQLSMVGEYFQSLAAVPMPEELVGMLGTGSNRFAVMDVVVVTGKGSKDGPSGAYLFRPVPLKLHGFGVHEAPSPAKSSENHTEQQPGRAKRSHADAEAVAQSASHQAPALNLPSRPAVPLTAIVPTKRGELPGAPTKKRKVHYYDVLDTRQTIAEEMEDIAKQAADKDAIYFTERRVTRSKLADAIGVDPLAIDISPPKQAGSSAPSRPVQHLTPVNRADSSSPEKPLILRHRTASHPPIAPRGPSTPQPRATDTPILGISSRKSIGTGASGPGKWEIPPLSRDCVVTYARDGTERQIRAERGGRFREEGVLIGVRYVLG
ncbi:MAG: hypothetical protein LQ346_000766 [Caloplaca aetnensis]|nr:MAG: hypothetical protein LQ346_000766 [Caloplaca aetnensis]